MIPRTYEDIAQCKDCHSGFFYGEKHTCRYAVKLKAAKYEEIIGTPHKYYLRSCNTCGVEVIRQSVSGRVTCGACRKEQMKEYRRKWKESHPGKYEHETVGQRKERLRLSYEEWFRNSRKKTTS